MTGDRAQPNFRFLVRQVTPYRGTLLLGFVLLLGESATALATPWLAGHITQMVLTGDAIALVLLLWLALIALQSIFNFTNGYLFSSSGARMLARLSTRLYDHLQALPLGWYHDQRRGEVLALLTNDVYILSGFVTGTLVRLLPLGLTFAGALVLMSRLDSQIALLAGLLIPVFFLMLKIVGRRIRPISTAYVKSYAEQIAVAEENLGLLPLIKSFVREPRESERFRTTTSRLLDLSIKQRRIQLLLSPSVQLLGATGIALLVWLSNLRVQEGTLAPGELVSLLLYGMLMTRPMSGLAGVYGEIQQVRGAAHRLLEVFSVCPEPGDTDKADLFPVKGEIRFEHVDFAYPGRDKTLSDLQLRVRAGETVALTGANGSGKSTLAHLLMRLLDPQRGRVTIDGVDIRHVSLASVRRQIGLVAQNVLLLNATVLDNIRYGRPDASQDDVVQAAVGAHADGFINELPDGYDTIVGDQGIKLSGGQRQRIALARALIKDPPILVLDEATAMFDPEGERTFIRECHQVLNSRTVILITHRPASLALADRIYRVEHGRVAAVSGPRDPRSGL